MIKRLVRDPTESREKWLDRSSIAVVEVTSEHPDHPIEQALDQDSASSWRAGTPGPQRIRLVFKEVQHLRKIRLHFQETAARTQEFCLAWATGVEQPLQTIVRQQWTFSQAGSTSELEDYNVNLEEVSVLQLVITPNISGGDAVAAMEEFLVAFEPTQGSSKESAVTEE